MDKKTLTPEESLRIISESINNFKMNYRESANTFLLWGWVLTLASFSNFIILKILHNKEAYELMGPYSFSVWTGFGIIGFIILFFMERKIKRDKKVYSYLDIYLKKIGYVTGASFFVAIFICLKLEIIPPPIMLLVAGIITIIVGVLLKFKPMIIGGISFFIFSIATTFVSNEYIALIVGGAIICGYLIPGYLLKLTKE